jgi:hypothetical protein
MQVIKENRQWQADLVDEISKNNWHAENPKDMSTFSTHLDRSVKLESKAQFCRKTIAFLRFPSMSDRQERICKNHRATFDWIFQDPSIIDKPWDDFVKWLSSDNSDSIYWITGKAGSGKSTLMRFISEDPRTTKHFKLWAKGNPLVIGSFFFWNSGTAMQMSRTGLMQSLLYQMLRDRPEHILKIFQTRWEAYDSLKGGSYPWTWTELKQAFQLVLLDKSLRFFFLIDGLDEFDGQHRELVDLIISASKLSNVKICVSSRPWLVFEDAFEGHPSLLLEQLSYSDIKLYVRDKFEENRRYVQLRSREDTYAADLVESVVQKASGVFLWVYLVVDSLLQGLDNADRVSDLQRRLELIPSDLEELFDKMLNSLEPFYFSHACQLIQIIRASQQPLTLLHLSFADEDGPLSAIQAKTEPLSEEQLLERVEMMRRRLKSRCKGLIEAPVRQYGADSDVQYIHRTAKDFLETPDIWAKILRGTDNSFDPNRSLCNSYLLQLKTMSPTAINSMYGWYYLPWCLEYATQVELSSGEALITYIDEVSRTCEAIALLYTGDRNGPWEPWTGSSYESIQNFIHLAVRCGLYSYMTTKVDQLSRNELAFLLMTYAEANGVLSEFKYKQALSKRPFPDLEMIRLLLESGASPRLAMRGVLSMDQPEEFVRDFIKSSASSRVARTKRWSRKVDVLFKAKRNPQLGS